ncbi:hypothetical protein [Streptomyces cyaneofuscatus]|uniref:Uncharacterized protein n=1 Tax=Streptomyces cyaneofuscatus TaxID=66883 RepID=A0ABZ1EVT6_9ACTN|nr:hypothetical protein [Streptomyces cyaneofuscatus]WSB08222.1 hypothetical protein OG849_13655 [Streptomyces cyaneofuscatus]WSD48245.1 hypothetical protein OG857_21750 [Streptomyces cyaneofuscatus]
MKIFGFAQNTDGTSDLAPLPDDVTDQVESTVTLSDGQSWGDTNGNTYTTRRSNRDQ